MLRRRLLKDEWCRSITIDIRTFTPEMIEWYRNIDGKINARVEPTSNKTSETRYYAAYGNSEWSFFGMNGTVRLRFCTEDASVALLFIIQFIDYIANHNMKEHLDEKNFSY